MKEPRAVAGVNTKSLGEFKGVSIRRGYMKGEFKSIYLWRSQELEASLHLAGR